MHVLTVAEVNAYLRELLEVDEVVGDVWVSGEISNFTQHSSGHCYFSLKHDNAVLRAVMWKSAARQQASLPTHGDAVLVHGRVSLYEVRGDIQLYVDSIQPAGLGILQAQYEALRRKLEAEGLFRLERKRPLPVMPRRIGIATAPQGAALQDMLNVLRRRMPLVEVILAPCLVQGERAPDQIVAALQHLATTTVDLIILARGGGSLEDLWAFNDEQVARAVFASPVPVITGVGHETDTTIVDEVADQRAPTPSVAAEIATLEIETLAANLQDLRSRAHMALLDTIGDGRHRLETLRDSLQRNEIPRRIARDRQMIDELVRRMQRRLAGMLELEQARLRGMQARLETLSPTTTLTRGYAVVQRADDAVVVTTPEQAPPGTHLRITLQRGTIDAASLTSERDE
jgi:exodeoxyribonuclease VII large subunit